jgi:hypothetical protein
MSMAESCPFAMLRGENAFTTEHAVVQTTYYRIVTTITRLRVSFLRCILMAAAVPERPVSA